MKIQINSGDLLDILKAVKVTDRSEVVMRFKDDRFLITCSDPSDVLLAAVLAPDSSMEYYDRGDYEKIGFKIKVVNDFIQSRTDMITLSMRDRTLIIDDESAKAKVGTLDPETVPGHMSGGPDINYNVTVEGDPSIIFDFVSREEAVVNHGSFYIGCKEEAMYLYSSGDTNKLSQKVEWDEFESVSFDWSAPNSSGSKNENYPPEDETMDVIMATGFVKIIPQVTDKCMINLANHHPMRYVYETEEGVMLSFIQVPRIASTGTRATVPYNSID